MQIHWLIPNDTLGAIGIDALTALLLSTVMILAFKFGIAPMPKALSLAIRRKIRRSERPAASRSLPTSHT